MCERRVPNDQALLSTFTSFSYSDQERLDRILSSSNPNFARRVIDLLLSGAYMNDSMCLAILSIILPYAKNDSVYREKEYSDKTSHAFEKTISLHFSRSFDYLLLSALNENEVDRYIAYIERFADSSQTDALESQDYYSRILVVDPGNIRIRRKLINADLQSDSACEKCITDFEGLLQYTNEPDKETYATICSIIALTPTTINKSEFMWRALGYHSEAPEGLKDKIKEYASVLLASKFWEQAEKYLQLVLSFDARDAETYFLLCLTRLQARNESEIASKKDNLIECREFAKSLSLYQSSKDPADKERATELLALTKKQKSNKKVKKISLWAGIAVAIIVVGVFAVIGIGKLSELREQKRIKAYDEALELLADEQWDAAYQAFLDLGDYKDSKTHLNTAKSKVDQENKIAIEKKNSYDAAVKLFQSGDFENALDAFQKMNGYEDSESYVTKCKAEISDKKYAEAVALYESGKYEDALAVFEFLENYKDSSSMVTSCKEKITERKYNEAVELLNNKQYEEAIKVFEKLNGYKDSNDRIKQCNDALTEIKYQNAVTLYNDGRFEESITVFTELGSYKGSESYKSLAKIKGAKVGDIITFGKYEQDNNTSNGTENIEWIVIDKKDGKLFVLSKQILDWMEYSENGVWRETAWDNCAIRKWLNDSFLSSAFSENEKKQIILSDVALDEYIDVALDEYIYGYVHTPAGKATKDYIFLLGQEEFKTYCTTKELSKGVRTEYALAKAKSTVDSYHSTYDQWWLRFRSEKYDRCVLNVDVDGNTSNNEAFRYSGIRPAMWIAIP